MSHSCVHEKYMGEIKVKLQQFDRHIEESEGRDGYRDRINDLEEEVRNLKRDKWLLIVICLVGSFLGEVLPFQAMLTHLFK